MRELLSASLVIIALTFVFGTFTGCETKEILNQMEKHSKSLKTLRADIIMNSFNSQLGESDITKGKLVYVPQNGGNPLMRIDWNSPVKESLALVNENYVLYRPRLKQAIMGSINEPQGIEIINEALALMNVSKEYLKANYNVKHLGEEKVSNGVLTNHLKFTPKAAKNYRTVDFWAGDEGMPIQMKVVFNTNDSRTILFTNIEKNVTINPNVFEIKIPKDTKIIKG